MLYNIAYIEDRHKGIYLANYGELDQIITRIAVSRGIAHSYIGVGYIPPFEFNRILDEAIALMRGQQVTSAIPPKQPTVTPAQPAVIPTPSRPTSDPSALPAKPSGEPITPSPHSSPSDEYGQGSSSVKVDFIHDKLKYFIKETHETNYGHDNLIIKGNVVFPPRQEYVAPRTESEYIARSHMQGGNLSPSQPPFVQPPFVQSPFVQSPFVQPTDVIFDKQLEIDKKDINPVKNQKHYFELFRYGWSENEKLHKPNASDEPTLCLSLFMPNNKLTERKTGVWLDWAVDYYINQIILILSFKHYFPNGNVRVYFDWFMLEKGFGEFPGVNPADITDVFDQLPKEFGKSPSINPFNIKELAGTLQYNDFEEENQKIVRPYFASYLNMINELEKKPFANGLQKFMAHYHLAASCINNNGVAQLSEPKGDFFVYKFKGPFIEHIAQGHLNQGHISNAYLGQEIRYISLRQVGYTWNGETVVRPKHLVWRDAHACSIAYNDSKWIKEFNTVTKTGKLEVYMFAISPNYAPDWHDKVKCSITETYGYKSILAGYTQSSNFTNTDKFMPDQIYYKSIGMVFLLDNNDNLPLKIHRPKEYPGYTYGIDEYANSSVLTLDYFKKRSIYYDYNFHGAVFSFNFGIAERLLLGYLKKTNQIGESVSKREFIEKIEELRNDIRLKDNDELRLLLAIYPTKYHISACIFNMHNNLNDFKFYHRAKFNTENLLFWDRYIPKDFLQDLTPALLYDMGLSCLSTAVSSPIEWCLNPYKYSEHVAATIKNGTKCSPANYYSGFYFDNPPSLDLGSLRRPDDIKHAVLAIQRNHFESKLYVSDYKLTDKKTPWIWHNVDDQESGHIDAKLQNVILLFGDDDPDFAVKRGVAIAFMAANLNGTAIGDQTQSAVWVPLIWKALLISGYDVPVSWIRYKIKTDEMSQRIFNDLAIELANIKGWAEYAVAILIRYHKKELLQAISNDFEDAETVKYAQKMARIVENSSVEELNAIKLKYGLPVLKGGAKNKYYRKYISYKAKYLMLKNKQ